MQADGYLYFSIADGPRVAVPFAAPDGRFAIDVWYGGDDAADADAEQGCHIECELTPITSDPRSAPASQFPGQ